MYKQSHNNKERREKKEAKGKIEMKHMTKQQA